MRIIDEALAGGVVNVILSNSECFYLDCALANLVDTRLECGAPTRAKMSS